MSRFLFGLTGMAVLLFLYAISPSLGWAAMVGMAYNIGKYKASKVPEMVCES